jgi:hypothetical protein
VEGLSEATKSYLSIKPFSDAASSDATVPPFSKASTPSSFTMIVHLDTERPLSEPKWVKSGDVQEWLKSMFGRMFWVAGDAAEEGWEKKIEVIDPDPVSSLLGSPISNLIVLNTRLLRYGLYWTAGRSTHPLANKTNDSVSSRLI